MPLLSPLSALAVLTLTVPAWSTCPENSAATEFFTELPGPSFPELAATPTAATVKRLTMVKATTMIRSSPRTSENATPDRMLSQPLEVVC